MPPDVDKPLVEVREDGVAIAWFARPDDARSFIRLQPHWRRNRLTWHAPVGTRVLRSGRTSHAASILETLDR